MFTTDVLSIAAARATTARLHMTPPLAAPVPEVAA